MRKRIKLFFKYGFQIEIGIAFSFFSGDKCRFFFWFRGGDVFQSFFCYIYLFSI